MLPQLESYARESRPHCVVIIIETGMILKLGPEDEEEEEDSYLRAMSQD
jgi:hypothetical protein